MSGGRVALVRRKENYEDINYSGHNFIRRLREGTEALGWR